ncbi:MAG: hypothetical protein M1818_004069 [Claussenomyces sp. TS43310]|nr:MAG: hypothetical protein M1818_004069 [Claussenomyces sp. TS43310]
MDPRHPLGGISKTRRESLHSKALHPLSVSPVPNLLRRLSLSPKRAKRKETNYIPIITLPSTAPALPVISYVQKQFDGEIEQDNKYRGKPTPEIDAEWLRIGLDTPGLRLTEEDPKKLNKSDAPDRPLHRIPDEFGGGYLAMLEVFHLLHCLDSLRQAIYKDYYTEDIKKASKSGWRVHTDHCIDILRETIMCTADVTPVTFYDAKLMPARKLPMPDCSTLHTCRNFDDILRWNAGNERTLQ